MRQEHERVVDRAMMDYVVMSRNVTGQLLEVRVLRREGDGMSGHFLLEGNMRVSMRRVKTKQVEEAKRFL